MNLSVVVGTRPEVIKLAPVILEARKQGHRVQVIFTGQHQQMALRLLKFFGIKPDLELEVMAPNQTLTSLSARILEKLDFYKETILTKFGSQCMVVQGDTTSALIAGYWAFCHRVPVAHVEAGLRTYDLTAPFPEEANRQLLGRITDFHFAPTQQSERALKKENTVSREIHVVGNTAIDALHFVLKSLKTTDILSGVPAEERLDPKITEFVGQNKLVLVTAHRRESFGNAFDDLCAGIRAVADAREDVRIVYPVHPNPNVRAPVEKLLKDHPRILLCDPMAYVGFIDLMRQASVLLTDSGGIQEEGPTLKKPILVMRETTERPEGVKAGFAKLVGTDPKKIRTETLKALQKGSQGRGKNPYGDGKSAARIVKVLERKLKRPKKA